MLQDKKTDIKKSLFDYLEYKQLSQYDHVRRMNEVWEFQRLLSTKKGPLEKNWNGVRLEEEEREDLEI